MTQKRYRMRICLKCSAQFITQQPRIGKGLTMAPSTGRLYSTIHTATRRNSQEIKGRTRNVRTVQEQKNSDLNSFSIYLLQGRRISSKVLPKERRRRREVLLFVKIYVVTTNLLFYTYFTPFSLALLTRINNLLSHYVRRRACCKRSGSQQKKQTSQP